MTDGEKDEKKGYENKNKHRRGNEGGRRLENRLWKEQDGEKGAEMMEKKDRIQEKREKDEENTERGMLCLKKPHLRHQVSFEEHPGDT